MERQFFINWPVVVEEAKQRRKAYKVTQQKLAMLAGVSTPTVSRFENNAKDIQLQSVLKILDVLGMLDRRQIIFPKPNPYFDFSKSVIRFNGEVSNKTLSCAISEEALIDKFQASSKDPMKIYVENQEKIEHEVRRKYIKNQLESDGSVLIKNEDL